MLQVIRSIKLYQCRAVGKQTRERLLPTTSSRRPATDILCTLLFTFAVLLHFQLSWNAVFPARECKENSYRCSVLLRQRKWAVALQTGNENTVQVAFIDSTFSIWFDNNIALLYLKLYHNAEIIKELLFSWLVSKLIE